MTLTQKIKYYKCNFAAGANVKIESMTPDVYF